MHPATQTLPPCPPPAAADTRTIQFAYHCDRDETLVFGRRLGEPAGFDTVDERVFITCDDGAGLIVHMAETQCWRTSLGIAPLSDTSPPPLGPGGWQVRYDLPCEDVPDSPLVLTVIAPATAWIAMEVEE